MKKVAILLLCCASCVTNPAGTNRNNVNNGTNSATNNDPDGDCSDFCPDMNVEQSDAVRDVPCEEFAFVVLDDECESPCEPISCDCRGLSYSACTPNGCIKHLNCDALCDSGVDRANECRDDYAIGQLMPFMYEVYCADQNAVPELECIALASFDRVFRIANWFDPGSPCDFDGVVCAAGSVVEIAFEAIDSNQLPDTFSNLPNLTSFSILNPVGNPKVSGELPPSFFSLTNLQSISFVNNGLDISSERLTEFPNLRRLTVTRSTQTSFVFPQSIGNLTSLTDLRLSGNQMTGSIPVSVSNLSILQTFDVSDNNLSGDIPSSLFDISTLDTIALDHNALTGEFPASIVTLNPTTFSASHNGCFTTENLEVANWLSNADSLWECGCTQSCP